MSGLQVDAINHISIEVSDLKQSEDFYRHLLGFEPQGQDFWPDSGPSVSFRTAEGQSLILSGNPRLGPIPETGAHQAYTTGKIEPGCHSQKARTTGDQGPYLSRGSTCGVGGQFLFLRSGWKPCSVGCSQGRSCQRRERPGDRPCCCGSAGSRVGGGFLR